MRTLPSLVAFTLATSLLGCPGPTNPPDDAFVAPDAVAANDAGTDAAADAFVAPDSPQPDAQTSIDAFLNVDATAPTMSSYSYVVSFAAAEEVVGGAVSGIDIDGMDSGSGMAGNCANMRPDYRSSLRGVGGIDNQLSAQLLGTLRTAGIDINRNLANAIAMGEFLLLVTVDDVDDFVDDPDGVLITVSAGEVTRGTAPRLDASGRIVPGQTFRRVMAGAPMAGELRGNRIFASAGSLPLPLVLGDPTSTVPLMGAQITTRISADRLFDGEAGGGAPVDAIIAFAETRGFAALARTLLARNADLDPDPAMMTSCRQVSVGFRLDAVSAVVE
jgi:hypothetical protein